MTCPYLEYRTADADRSFDPARAYCTAVEAFVQPMRADVCNDRYDLRHDADCEFYLAAASDEGTVRSVDAGSGSTDVGAGSDGNCDTDAGSNDGAAER